MKRINLTQRTIAAVGLGVMLAMAPLAMAQEAPAPDAGGQTSSANEPGSIDTSKQTTTTTTTTTQNDTGDYQAVGADDNSAPLPNTGGEPLLFVLAGSILIGGGWVLRRKMAQSES
jgi:LPXTG-motif cell wall-anchored protein